ncbi:hypothetical protein [Agrococcus casei]|uniref:hypothetical protein n=1 Tax=Agrococcus casei TaxID=343512 RepID=UPI0011783FF9|nr:hypothetical protein [Agrococcus casei]
MTRYYLGVVTPNGLDPTAYATGALAQLQHGKSPVFDQAQVDTWWTRNHFGDSQITATDLRIRLQSPLRNGRIDPVLRMVGIIDLAGTWHERVALIDDSTAEIRLSNRDWINTLEVAAAPNTTLTIVFARAQPSPQGVQFARPTNIH